MAFAQAREVLPTPPLACEKQIFSFYISHLFFIKFFSSNTKLRRCGIHQSPNHCKLIEIHDG